MTRVYVLLPPSETKHPEGHGPALDLAGLSFPGLTAVRARLVEALGRLSDDLPTARAALRVSANFDDEIRHNTKLLSSPTMPALSRYTGVLYAALNSPKLSPAETSRAQGRILITSALFGLLAGGDPIPAYRLSAGSRIPVTPTIAAVWRADVTTALASLAGPVLDLRSGAYAAFGPAVGAITVRVVTVTRSGDTKPVSHDNKAIKGVLARLVATTRAAVDDVPKLLALAYRAGLSLHRAGPATLDLVAPTLR